MEAQVKHGIAELQELIAGLELLAITGKKIMADGKVNLADAAHLVELGTKLDVVVKAFDGLAQVKEEAKDIDAQEALALVRRLFDASENYHKA